MAENQGTRREWAPMPRNKCRKLASATAMAIDFLQVFMLGAAFVLSIVVVGGIMGRPAPLFRDPLWWICLVLLVAGPFWFLYQWLERSHQKKRLAIDAERACFGKSCVLFADLGRISTGEFKVAMEKYVPSLEKAAVLATSPVTGQSKLAGAAKARQQLRDKSITLTKRSGEQVHWVGALAVFADRDLEEFFEIFLENVPGIIFDDKRIEA